LKRFRLISCLLLATLVLALVPAAHAVKNTRDLPPIFRHWIEAEVSYIISTDEKKEFLALTTDEQRDDFIERFWRARNQNPGSEFNGYKEEHYRRLAYVNEHYGIPGAGDGWKTDRGRIYITLGAPKQLNRHNDVSNVRPLEIWFYQAETPVLPPYFYVVFYKESTSEDFKLYSPRYDGPVKLCSTGETRNDPVQALTIIKKAMGMESARTMVTLIPTEPVNINEWQPSMESDAMLEMINNLPDNPYTVNRIRANRMREHVTTSILSGDNEASLSYGAFRDSRGRMTLSTLFSLRLPDARLIGPRGSSNGYYDMTLRTELLSAAGKLVYTQEERLRGDLTETQAEVARKKRFAAESRLPIVPGGYELQVTLTNNIDKSAIRQSAHVTVPSMRAQGLALSTVVAYKNPAGIKDAHDLLPFSASHFRFTPRGAQNVTIRQGEKLPIFFQLWLDGKDAATTTAEKIHLRYQFGSIAATRNEATTETEDVDAANHDTAGNLLTGHTIDTSSLMPGAYQVVVTATREGESRSAYGTLNLHVAPTESAIDNWTAYGANEQPGDAADDYKRGLAAETQSLNDLAASFYQLALIEGNGEMKAFDRLAALFQKNGKTDQLAGLGKLDAATKNAADPGTLQMIAVALGKAGENKTIIKLLEAQLKLQQPRVELYNLLAEACQATGDTNRAKEVRSLAEALKGK